MMADPWIEPVWKFGAYFGGIGGSVVGVIGGALGCCSYFVAQGKGKRWILGGYGLMAALGAVSAAVGVYAWSTGQPYAIWYPLLMLGVTTGGVFGGLFPVIRARYREAEQRKIEAEGIRGS